MPGYPDRDAERRTHSGGWQSKLLLAMVPLVAIGFSTGLIAWGRTEARVDQHDKDLQQIAPLLRAVAELTTTVAVLTVEVRYLRELRTQVGRRENP